MIDKREQELIAEAAEARRKWVIAQAHERFEEGQKWVEAEDSLKAYQAAKREGGQ